MLIVRDRYQNKVGLILLLISNLSSLVWHFGHYCRRMVQLNESHGVSLSKQILQRIDINRGDISRSKYIQRVLEKHLDNDNKGAEQIKC
jgi:hypothetical protein